MTIDAPQAHGRRAAAGAEARFRALLPPDCEVAEDDPSAHEHGLHPLECAAIEAALPARRREFAAGRRSARRALERLGYSNVAIPVGPMREPLFPPGVLGTITHCQGCCAAAVVPRGRARGIGIDVEQERALEPGVARLILSDAERSGLPSPSAMGTEHPEIVAFSAKEAFYKAFFPSNRIFLEFLDVSAVLYPREGMFEVTVRCPRVPEVWRAGTPCGRYTIADGFVYAAVVL